MKRASTHALLSRLATPWDTITIVLGSSRAQALDDLLSPPGARKAPLSRRGQRVTKCRAASHLRVYNSHSHIDCLASVADALSLS
jgi:hypothetical protein